MIHQVNAQRHRYWRGFKVGTFDVGTIFYRVPRDRWGMERVNEPWIIEAWCGVRWWQHCAVVRSLRTGCRILLADCHIRAAVDSGFEVQP